MDARCVFEHIFSMADGNLIPSTDSDDELLELLTCHRSVSLAASGFLLCWIMLHTVYPVVASCESAKLGCQGSSRPIPVEQQTGSDSGLRTQWCRSARGYWSFEIYEETGW